MARRRAGSRRRAPRQRRIPATVSRTSLGSSAIRGPGSRGVSRRSPSTAAGASRRGWSLPRGEPPASCRARRTSAVMRGGAADAYAAAHRPSRFASATLARPAGCMRPSAARRSTVRRFASDQTLRGRRGEPLREVPLVLPVDLPVDPAPAQGFLQRLGVPDAGPGPLLRESAPTRRRRGRGSSAATAATGRRSRRRGAPRRPQPYGSPAERIRRREPRIGQRTARESRRTTRPGLVARRAIRSISGYTASSSPAR